MAIPAGTMYIIGNAISDSTGNAISSMDWGNGGLDVYDVDDNEPPAIGDVVRVTGTGVLKSEETGPLSAIFRFKHVYATGEREHSVTVEDIPTGTEQDPTEVFFWFQFLLTFRNIDGVPPLYVIQMNGIIGLGNYDVYTRNYVLGPHTEDEIPLAGTGSVDVVVNPDEGLTVKFDECTIEYLGGPS